MAVLTMGKKKPIPEIPPPAAPPVAGDGESPRAVESSLKVYQTEQQIIAKIATHRNLSVKELFREKDFQTFLKHVLLAELRKEAERLGDPR